MSSRKPDRISKKKANRGKEQTNAISRNHQIKGIDIELALKNLSSILMDIAQNGSPTGQTNDNKTENNSQSYN